MASISCYVLDIDYRVVGGKAVIYLYGRTPEGQQICLVDKSFQPYFTVIPHDKAAAKKKLEGLQVEKSGLQYDVVKVEEVKKKYVGKEVTALKVFVNIPKGVPVVSEEIRHWDEISSTHEYDILFVRRYLLDKQITPLTLVTAEGESTNEKLRVPAFEISSIVNTSEDTLREPKILAVDIETYSPDGKQINPEQYPILMIAVYGKDIQKVFTWKRFKGDKVVVLENEAAMIEAFKQIVHDYKPDVLTGYYSDGFDFPYIIKRAKKFGVPLDIGLDYSELRMNRGNQPSAQIRGIVHFDVLQFIRRVVGRTMETDTYTLDAVAQELLGEPKHDVDMDQLAPSWDANSGLEVFAAYNLKDAELTYRLAFKVLPNLIELVKIVSLPMYDVPRMGFSQLVEWFIMKQAIVFNEIFLNKPSYHQMQYRLEQRAQGALVYEPQPGLYKDIAVFDFASLYPTIIVSHNISLDTLQCDCCRGSDLVPLEGKKYWFCTKKKGFLPSIIEDLISRRSRIKEIIRKEEEPDALLMARNNALKLMGNAFYGYLGFNAARWYCVECVSSTTAYARHYIKMVIRRAGEAGFKVLYSDTDSVFLLLQDKTEEDSKKFAEEINMDLPSLMELEFEGSFPSGIFVGTKGHEGGAKKKYALLDKKGELKIKGFETVRRNVSIIAREMQREVLSIVLKEHNVEKAKKHVQQLISDLRKHTVPVEKMIISTQLTKGVDEYDNIGPHVAVAKRMIEKGTSVGAGTIVRFVIAIGAGKIRDKAKIPEEITPEEYDAEYYINNQLIPAVDKIFEVLGVSKEDLSADKKQSTLGSFM